MKLGLFDESKAKRDAKRFLEKSIHTLGILLNQDTGLVDENSENPYQIGTAMYHGFETLKAEIGAYSKL